MIAGALPARAQDWGPAAWSRMLLPIMFGLTGFVAVSHVEAAIEAAGSSIPLAAILLAVAAAVAQWARWAARGLGQAALFTGALAFAGLAAIWVCSRTVGLPFGLSPRAPVGILDAATALDEVLVAAAALILRGSVRRSENLLSGLGFAALSVSFMLLSMGCSIGTARRATGVLSAQHGTPLYCHLY